jgi:PD-(D/E)XK nuclease superfamily
MSTAATTGVKPFTWSYSALKNFQTCPRRYEAYSVTKSVREPESEAIRQGHALHKAFELRVRDGTKLPLGMGMYEPYLAQLADVPDAEIHTEQRLGLTAAFEPAMFFGAGVWFRTVLDYTLVRPGGKASIVDYKTGKPNEDLTQLALAAVTLFAHDPSIEQVHASALFVTHNAATRLVVERHQATDIWAEVLPQVSELEAAHISGHFPPRPGGLCRRYCGVKSCPFWGK